MFLSWLVLGSVVIKVQMEKWTSADILPNCIALGTILICNHWTLLSLSDLINYFCTYKQQNIMDYFYTKRMTWKNKQTQNFIWRGKKCQLSLIFWIPFSLTEVIRVQLLLKTYRNSEMVSLWPKPHDIDHFIQPNRELARNQKNE